MIEVYTGEPGACKTTALARKAKQCLIFNEKTHLATGYKKKVLSNIRFSSTLYERYLPYIEYFDDLEDVDSMRDCDIFIDEVSLYFDAHNWEALPRRVKKFLRLHRHYGVNIYGASQDFKTVDPSFRRLVAKGHLYYFDRIIGTEEPNPAKPPQTFPYVLSVRRTVKIKDYDAEAIEYRYTGFKPFLFTNKDFSIFDTHQEFDLGAINITSEGYSDLIKYQRVCPEDGYTKVYYK